MSRRRTNSTNITNSKKSKNIHINKFKKSKKRSTTNKVRRSTTVDTNAKAIKKQRQHKQVRQPKIDHIRKRSSRSTQQAKTPTSIKSIKSIKSTTMTLNNAGVVLWENQLSEWAHKSAGPASIIAAAKTNRQFLWRTNKCEVLASKSKLFMDEIVYVNNLPKQQDYSQFEEHFNDASSKLVVSFANLSGTSILVVPTPMPGKNFATISDFTREASLLQKQALWKQVAFEVHRLVQKGTRVWVSTHGYGVPYLHVRIDTSPKYYGTSDMAKM